MKKIKFNILVILLAMGITPKLIGQDGPKINKDLVQEGIEEPDHPSQDLKTYTIDDIIKLSEKDDINAGIIKPYLHAETDNSDDI